MYFIYWYDYALLPVYLVVCVLLLRGYFNSRHYEDAEELWPYFRQGMWLKFFGCIAIGMVYEYYYRGAFDGRFYFEGGKMLSRYFYNHPTEIFKVLKSNTHQFNVENLDGLNIYDTRVYAESSFNVAKITGLVDMVSFNAFLPCSLLFCALAYLALWNLFVFFIHNYNLNYRVAAFCSIYIPSLLIWSSSIFKDTVTFAALCWLFICGYHIFIKPRKLILNIAGFLVSAFLIASVKVYILAAFLPFYIFYVFSALKSRIGNPGLRSLVTPVILVVSVISIAGVMSNLGDILGNYALENVLETASLTYGYIAELNAGSAYDLNVDYSSIPSLLGSVPAGINVTLFRPYPWEYLKPFTLFASLESMVLLYFTVKVLRRVGIRNFFSAVFNDPTIQFCLLFSLLFAFMVGISSSNFGTLVRYKIPILPFYTLFLALLYQRYFPEDPAISRVAEAGEEEPEALPVTEVSMSI